MGELPVEHVPFTVVTGALGVGKTTAILDTLSRRSGDERWAVLVNEFGEVGIDGAVLASGGVEVREVPGGCICCTAGLSLRVGLVRLLREVQPDRLFLEPTGLARPAALLDALRTPGLREALSPRATITLVDPRRFADPAQRRREVYHDQLEAADVLVANFDDLADEAQRATFREVAAAWYPPKVVVAETRHGRLDPAWLDLRPSAREVLRVASAPTEPEAESRGWVFPVSMVFERELLEEALQSLVRPGEVLPRGVLRLKGVFRTRRAWLLVDATADTIRWRPIAYRRDSRLDIIVEAGSGAVWEQVEARVRQAAHRRGGSG